MTVADRIEDLYLNHEELTVNEMSELLGLESSGVRSALRLLIQEEVVEPCVQGGQPHKRYRKKNRLMFPMLTHKWEGDFLRR